MRSKSKVFLALALVFILVASVPMSVMVSDADSSSSNDTYSSTTAYDLLSQDQKEGYDKFSAAMKLIEEKGDFPKELPIFEKGHSTTEVQCVIYAYMSDHPDKFWASYYDHEFLVKDNNVIGVINSYSVDKNTLNSMKAQLTGEINKINKSDPNASMGDRIKYLHDTINNRTTYEADDKKYPNCGNVYGLLCEGKSKCDSYSLTFALLCHREEMPGGISGGIPCVVEVGYINKDGPKEGGHAWNIVKVDNKWYYMDLTWDDTIGYDYRYEYFLIGSQTSVQGGSFQSSRTGYDYGIDVSKDRYNYEPYSFLEKNKAVIAVIVVIVIIVIAFLIWRYTKKKKEQRLQAEMADAINSGECCPACGTPIPPGQDFCPACGKKAKVNDDEKEPPKQ